MGNVSVSTTVVIQTSRYSCGVSALSVSRSASFILLCSRCNLICQMNFTPMVAAISLESREAMEMLLFESSPLDARARVQIDQTQHVNYVHCVE